jgi:hypothetical protein
LPTNPDAAFPPEAVKLDTIKTWSYYDFVASACKKALTERFDAEILHQRRKNNFSSSHQIFTQGYLLMIINRP